MGIWVILIVLCLGFFMYGLATLPEESFPLPENKIPNDSDISYSFDLKQVVVEWGKLGDDGKLATESFSAPGSGYLNVIESVEIQENKQGRELFIRLRPFWFFVYCFWGTLFVFTIVGLRYIFKTLR